MAAAAPTPALAEDNFQVHRSRFITSDRGRLLDHYDLEKKQLGAGTYGTVHVGTHKQTGSKRAVKTIPKDRVRNLERFQTEINILKSLDHPNIIKLFETFEDSRNVYLVMELCRGGELFDRIISKGHFTERDAANLMRQILSATVYCHSHNICHRDLKPENFLFQSPAEDAALKIIDFGLSRIFDERMQMTTKAGTPYYVAPQVLEGRYDKSCDCWSVGVICYILLCGYPPFYGDNDAQILDRVRRGHFSFSGREWENVSEEAKDLIRHLLKLNPAERFTAEQALAHPWVQSLAASAAVVPLSLDTLQSLRNFRAHEKLKRAALTAIAQQLTENEIQDLRNLFLSLDRNGDGCLTLAELAEGMSQLPNASAEDIQRILAGVDTDGSGTIDYTEFIAATMERRVYLQEEKLWTAFRMFDKDGSGKITAQELREVLGGPDGADMSPQICEEIIKEVDQNNDGEIDFSEFLEMMRRSRR